MLQRFANYLNFGLLLLTIGGIVQISKRLRQSYEIQKATIFKDLYLMMFGDSEIRDAFYLIDFRKFVYDESFIESDEQKLIDRMLSYINLVCELHAQKMLTEREMSFFEYEFTRVYKNPMIQEYFEYLTSLYKSLRLYTPPFASFITYSEKVLLSRTTLASEQQTR